MKLEIFKKKKNFRKGGFHTNPDICWEILLYIGFAIITGVIIASFFMFQKIDKGFTVPDLDTNIQSKSVSKDRINKVLQYFSVRAEKSAQILVSPAQLVDPSL